MFEEKQKTDFQKQESGQLCKVRVEEWVSI